MEQKQPKTPQEFEQAVRESVQRSFDREANDQRLYQIVRDLIAEKWTGKTLNKRMVDQLKERTGGDVWMETRVHNQPQLRFGERNAEYVPAIYLSRTYNEASVEKLDQDNPMHTEAATLRQQKRTKFLKGGKEIARAAALAHTIKTAWDELYAMDNECGSYTARTLSGVKPERW